MRHLGLLALFLPVVASSAAIHVAQGGPGKQPTTPATPPQPCYTLVLYHLPEQDRKWARIATGDEWITGCLGPAGKCYVPVWIPC
jgi:hypothetical protein